MLRMLLPLLAVVVLVWLVRRTLRSSSTVERPPEVDTPRPMLRCAQCGLHLPGDEALPGRGGVFCSDAHRAAFEQRADPD